METLVDPCSVAVAECRPSASAIAASQLQAPRSFHVSGLAVFLHPLDGLPSSLTPPR
ncbi:MAG: hypothetical protein JNJ54_19715 [Myxococcaceae bacterium]|nr:hypothetical protein [Myxococcaceae bacterium]